MRIAIIGSNGFIGSNLFNYFYKKKNIKIKKMPSYKKNINWINLVCKNISLFSPNIIINCSASQNLLDSKKAIKSLIDSNIYAQCCFLSEAKKNKNFIGYITFGSKWEYDQKGGYSPNSFYAATKFSMDFFLKYFSNSNLAAVSLKIFDTYGENDPRKKIYNLLLNSYKKKKLLKLTPGNQELDYVNIKDLCEAINLICKYIVSKRIIGFKKYTISSKKPITIKKFIKILKKELKNKLNVKLGAIKYRNNESMKSLKKVFNIPGWKPKVNFVSETKKIFDKY